MNHSEERLQRIEDYLSDRLSPEERAAVERDMREDDDFRQLVDRHRLLLEGIQMSALLKERHKLAAFQRALEEEEKAAAAEPRTAHVRLRPLWRQLAVAAGLFLFGLLAGYLILDSLSRPEPLYGEGDAGLPLFEQSVPLRQIREENGRLVSSDSTLSVLIFQSRPPAPPSRLEDGQLSIYLDRLPQNGNWQQSDVEIILQTLTDPDLRASFLKIGDQAIPIQLTDETFSLLFPRQ